MQLGARIACPAPSSPQGNWFQLHLGQCVWVGGILGILCFLALSQQFSGTRITTLSSQVPASVVQPGTSAFSSSSRGRGEGGRASALQDLQPMVARDVCFPTDATCWMQTVSQWVAQQTVNALEPMVKGLLDNSVDILYQTPATDTYQNATVLAIWNVLMGAATAALACLVVIGGYNVIVAPYFGLPHSSIGAFLPRLLLAFGAAHFSLSFLGLFIELENTLCRAVLQTAGLDMLTNLILSLFVNVATQGLLLWILVVVLGILSICLAGQMVVRLGMVAMLIALAAPALLCLALPQTQRYGRLWITLFTSSILVQFFQVTALALGGMLLTSVGATLHLPDGIAQALMCIGVLYLVLKVPGMLNTWALAPMQEAGSGISFGGSSGGGAAGSVQGYAQDQAVRQQAIDALATTI